MNFADFQRGDIRLATLQCLAVAAEYRASDRLIGAYLTSVGISTSADAITTQADWLAEQGLVRIEQHGTTRVLVITERGADVAAGRAYVSGINRPRA